MMEWRQTLDKWGIAVVKAWDLEARNAMDEKVEDWIAFRREHSGVSIASTLDLSDPFCGWTFYSDKDEYPLSIVGLSEALREADMTIGYNTMGYDHAVVRGLCDHHHPNKELDLLNNIIKPAMKPDYMQGKGLWGIDAFCMRTLGIGKTSTSGAHAPTLSRLGRWGELVTYNCQDTALVARLFIHMLEHRTVVMPSGDLLDVGDAIDHGLERIAGLVGDRQAAVAS